MAVRELTDKERTEYDVLIENAKQLTLFGTEEDLDPDDYIFLNNHMEER